MSDKDRIGELLVNAKQAVKKKNLGQAEEYLKQALIIDSEDVSCLDLMGFVCFFQKQYPESEACCRKVLEKKPGHAYALLGLGMSLSKQGELEKGLDYLRRAIERQPRWPEGYWDLAIVLKEAGRFDEALDVLNDGLAHCEDSQARFEGLISHIEKMRNNG